MFRVPLKQLAELLDTTCDAPGEVAGAAADSRLVQSKNLFVAIKGAQTDGHAYLDQAALQGASAALVASDFQGPSKIPLLRVKDPLESLQLLAKRYLGAMKAKVIAITGSVGKTTTKDFTTTLLQQVYKVAATPGNNNSQVGLPLAILNHVKGDEEVLVLEMGMTHPGNLSALIELAPPDIAVITQIALAHAQNFSSIEEIALTKAEILAHPKTALAFLDKNMPALEQVMSIGPAAKQTFSTTAASADFFLKVVDNQMMLFHQGAENTLGVFPLPGTHNLSNLLPAVAVARALNISWEAIRLGIEKLKLPERRLEMVEKKGILFVNDSYNANSASMKAALDSLPLPKPDCGRKIAVLGEMLELGNFSKLCHEEVATYALDRVDQVFCLGEETRTISECWDKVGRQAAWFSDREALTEALKKVVKPGDVVLLKGSRSKQLWKVLDGF